VAERPTRQSRSHATERSRRTETPQHVQTSFLAPEEATLYAELTRLRLLINEISATYRRRLGRGDGTTETVIRSPRDIATLLMPEMRSLPHEEFRLVLLNSKNAVLDVPTLYRGTLNSAPVRIAEVFRPAILLNAAALAAVHCHPSGDPTPSPEDVHVTQQIVEAGQLLDIECLDHVIIGRDRFVSLKERGLGFSR
jgi:DNA repair protein RadC